MNTFYNDVLLKQLKAEDQLTNEQLSDIAGLVYDTDLYIYPAMFRDRTEACLLIPEMMNAGDRMFQKENLYVAYREERIVGLILWHKGPLDWNTDAYEKALNKTGCLPSPHFMMAKEQYFDSYREVDEHWISIMNVSVSKEYRNYGIGRKMLEHFLNQNMICNGMELFVLAENPAACHLYISHGFVLIEQLPGFSISTEKPLCYRMCRDFEYRENDHND